MSKLFRILATKKNNVAYDIPQNIGLNTKLVLDVKPVTSTSCDIKYKHLDGTNPIIFTAGSAATSVNSAMNAANTTDVNSILVTQLNTADDTPKYRGVDPFYIETVMVDATNSNRSYVYLQNFTKTKLEEIYCNNTQAAIIAAANA
jgi:hypothetical protein